MEKCGCSYNAEDMIKWQDQQMEKHGWYSHYVMDEGVCNLHTHGIQETFEHPDFQIVIAIPPRTAGSIFWRLANLIKEGKKFEAGQIAEGIIGNNLKVTFIEVNEGNRRVLRIILPDKNGTLDPLEQESFFAAQYTA